LRARHRIAGIYGSESVVSPEVAPHHQPYVPGMTHQTPRSSEPAGGDGLLIVIAAAIVFVVIGEAAFVAYPSLWLMPLAVLGALVVTAGVIYAAMRTIENDTPVTLPRPRPRTESAPEPAQSPKPVRARPAIGH
jgi:hypothetical protein